MRRRNRETRIYTTGTLPRRRRRRRGGVLALAAVAVCCVLAITLFGVQRIMPLLSQLGEAAGLDAVETVDPVETQVLETMLSTLAPSKNLSELEQELAKAAETDSRFATILENISLYTEEWLNLALKNPDAVDFVAGYPAQLGSSYAAADIDLSGDYIPGEIPLLMQWDARWGYAAYGSNVMGLAGCGPTCLSMVVVGLTGNTEANPLAVADYSDSQGWYWEGEGTSWELMRTGAAHYGLTWQELGLDEAAMINALNQGQVIIASMLPGDFTDFGHFIVLYAYEDGAFLVRDPNSYARSAQSWSYETLSTQIGNMWVYSY